MSEDTEKSFPSTALAEFGTSPSFPAMVLPDVEGFNTFLKAKQTAYFQERAESIREQYTALSDLAADTEFLNTVDKRYEPSVGKTYWVYESASGVFLSIVSPTEWTDRTRPAIYYGEFMLSGDGTWQRSRDECASTSSPSQQTPDNTMRPGGSNNE